MLPSLAWAIVRAPYCGPCKSWHPHSLLPSLAATNHIQTCVQFTCIACSCVLPQVISTHATASTARMGEYCADQSVPWTFDHEVCEYLHAQNGSLVSYVLGRPLSALQIELLPSCWQKEQIDLSYHACIQRAPTEVSIALDCNNCGGLE